MTVADLETLGPGDEQNVEAPTDPSGKKITGRSPTRIALERLRKDKLAVFSATVVLVLVLSAIFAPLICGIFGIGGPYETNGSSDLQLGYPNVGPPFHSFTWDHPLGLAPLTAYDNLARLLFGLRTSLGVALGATVFSTVIGIVIGLMAGFARGALDRVISFVIDLFLSFPFILGALAIAPIITSRFATQEDKLKWVQFFTLISVLVIFGWMYLARLIRGQVLSLREREFIHAAQVIGAPTRRILFKELLPNLIAPIVVSISLTLPGFVAAEAGLSFLGIGITAFPSLGQTILRATPFYSTYPLYLYVPVAIVAILVLSLNLLGDSVRDAFDPKTRR
jgi:ABC-type dipeptide/oligopeptide/nickel transport system permease subunit